MIYILFLLVIQSTVYCKGVSQFTSLGESIEQFLGPENWSIAQALPCGDQTEVDNEMFELAVNSKGLTLYVFERLPNCEFQYRFRLDSENDRTHRQSALKTSLFAAIARGSEAGKIIDELVVTAKGQRWDIHRRNINPPEAPSHVATVAKVPAVQPSQPAVQLSQPAVKPSQPAVQPSPNAKAATERASRPSLEADVANEPLVQQLKVTEAPIIPPSTPDSADIESNEVSPPVPVIAANQQTSRTGQTNSETSMSLTNGNTSGLGMTDESAEVSEPHTNYIAIFQRIGSGIYYRNNCVCLHPCSFTCRNWGCYCL
jgi:hypothetical protein